VPNSTADNLLHSFLHVQDGGRIERVPVSERFWSDLAAGAFPELDQGRLISAFSFSEPWPTWERHPAGEELVMLLCGAATFLLEDAEGERALELQGIGAYVLVPKGVWHTARTIIPTTLLFLTPGAGTEHRPL
jgi:hypothetical protein